MTSPRSLEATSLHLPKALLWASAQPHSLAPHTCQSGNVGTQVQGRHPWAAPRSSVRECVVPK